MSGEILMILKNDEWKRDEKVKDIRNDEKFYIKDDSKNDINNKIADDIMEYIERSRIEYNESREIPIVTAHLKINYNEQTKYGKRSDIVKSVNKIQNPNAIDLKEGMFGFDEYTELLTVFDSPIYIVENLIDELKKKDLEFRKYWKEKEPWLCKNTRYIGPQDLGKIMQNHEKYNFNILIETYCKFVIEYRKKNIPNYKKVEIYKSTSLYKGIPIEKWFDNIFNKIFGPLHKELHPEFSSVFSIIVYKYLLYERKNTVKESIYNHLKTIWELEYNKRLIKLLKVGQFNILPDIPEKLNIILIDKLIKYTSIIVTEYENDIENEIIKLKKQHEFEIIRLRSKLEE